MKAIGALLLAFLVIGLCTKTYSQKTQLTLLSAIIVIVVYVSFF